MSAAVLALPRVPERSYTQRMDALGRANRIRVLRAELKREIFARRMTATSILLDVPDWAETMKVDALLISVRGLGRTKVNQILARHRVSPSKTLGGMTQRQRIEIAAALGGR